LDNGGPSIKISENKIGLQFWLFFSGFDAFWQKRPEFSAQRERKKKADWNEQHSSGGPDLPKNLGLTELLKSDRRHTPRFLSRVLLCPGYDAFLPPPSCVCALR